MQQLLHTACPWYDGRQERLLSHAWGQRPQAGTTRADLALDKVYRLPGVVEPIEELLCRVPLAEVGGGAPALVRVAPRQRHLSADAAAARVGAGRGAGRRAQVARPAGPQQAGRLHELQAGTGAGEAAGLRQQARGRLDKAGGLSQRQPGKGRRHSILRRPLRLVRLILRLLLRLLLLCLRLPQ